VTTLSLVMSFAVTNFMVTSFTVTKLH